MIFSDEGKSNIFSLILICLTSNIVNIEIKKNKIKLNIVNETKY